MTRHRRGGPRFQGPQDIQELLDFLTENHDGKTIYKRLRRRMMRQFGGICSRDTPAISAPA